MPYVTNALPVPMTVPELGRWLAPGEEVEVPEAVAVLVEGAPGLSVSRSDAAPAKPADVKPADAAAQPDSAQPAVAQPAAVQPDSAQPAKPADAKPADKGAAAA